jgi:hypothetical protein
MQHFDRLLKGIGNFLNFDELFLLIGGIEGFAGIVRASKEVTLPPV